MKAIRDRLLAFVRERLGSKPGERLTIPGLGRDAKSLLTAVLAVEATHRKSDLLFVTSDYRDLEPSLASVRWFLGAFGDQSPVLSFPDCEVYPYDEVSVYRDISFDRSAVLTGLSDPSRPPQVVLTTVRGLLERVCDPSTFRRNILTLKPGETADFAALEERLIYLGYTREEFVEDPASFSVRGEIVDIFPPQYGRPVRLDFFDNQLESVRFFDTENQKSVAETDRAVIPPVREVVLEKNLIPASGPLADRVREKLYFEGIESYRPLFNPLPATLLDHLAGPGRSLTVAWNSFSGLAERAAAVTEEFKYLHEKHADRFRDIPPALLLEDFSSMTGRLLGRPSMDLSLFRASDSDLDLKPEPLPRYMGNVVRLRSDLEGWLKSGATCVVASENEGTLSRLKSLIEEDPLVQTGGVQYLVSPVEEGFLLGAAGFRLVTDLDIYDKRRSRTGRPNRGKTQRASRDLFSFIELKQGDFVVHSDYGIGLFRDIVKMTVEEKVRDFLLIEYRDADKLYVPLDQIDLVQKYIGQDGSSPELSKLGSASWDSLKHRIKESLQRFAQELLELYSIRSRIEGFAFPSDTEWERQFDLEFKYTETPDQLEAIRRVKEDMEKPTPMDRLICGDVGYGKTEVAMRAAFKAVMAGKQVAVLVPTTILTEQHYHTFNRRFAAFPFRVEAVSRFKEPRVQREILRRVGAGEVDIVIGTHRLLSKDVRFRDLGLLIVDEEQKFGVRHKERLKVLKKSIDILSMSATPIPRTLNFSLSGIRDISVIETPPQDRLPIATYIVPFEERIIIEGVGRELGRGGQVFFIHNEVRSIEKMAKRLRTILPSVRIEVAHAQLDEDVLEEIMIEFYDRKIDVLIASTIVESGLDLPNVNTIYINEAQDFGLSQLYQLKGRVGRSSQRAFAYLLYPADRGLSDIAKKRLSILNEYTELGSGVKIALKDLEIRGAGSLFGTQQHGNILSVGLDMYLKLLDATVRTLKGQPAEEETETNLNVNYSGFIPDAYIPSLKSKIHFYKEIMRTRSLEELDAIETELTDRFGRVPVSVRAIFLVKKVKILARTLGVVNISETGGEMSLRFSRLGRRDEAFIRSVLEYLLKNPGQARLNARRPDEMSVLKERGREPVERLYDFLKSLTEFIRLPPSPKEGAPR